ncbi:hypothetical protein [Streptomyces sp. DH24]|uniref:hypothetical protein n=1 Tax=Streptomyces sp. DH24 TaxID=3040123 RepID=UPI0024423976|nr:hypothetical protein [Streptomyces sp. DH24]MDG9715916.1 hypothetical protein [Streptomyces sp. DH24]
MPTAVLTDRERTAVQAYLRLLHTVRASLDTASGPPDPRREPGARPAAPPVVPPSVLAEAELALSEAGLNGNEEAFFRLLRDWCPQA